MPFQRAIGKRRLRYPTRAALTALCAVGFAACSSAGPAVSDSSLSTAGSSGAGAAATTAGTSGSGGAVSGTGGASGGTSAMPTGGTGATPPSGGAGANSGGNQNAAGTASGGAAGTASSGDAGAGGGAEAQAGASSGGASAGAGGTGVALGEGCLEFSEPEEVGTAAAPELSALSGMVASRQFPGVLYANSDAGDSGTVWAMDETGATLATFTLVGAPATDWEDVAVGPGPNGEETLYVADIGDNAAGGMGQGQVRDEIQIMRLPEPTVTLGQVAVEVDVSDFEVLRFTYPDTVYNAEGFAVDPVTGDLLVLTKVTSGASAVFRAPGDTPADTPTVLEKVADVATGTAATAADMSPNGDRFLARTTDGLLLWARAEPFSATFAVDPIQLSAADESQPEGVTFSADGSAVLSSGEVDPVIYRAEASCE